ncbi:MAG: HD domain-containing protein [Treponema sp.]|nr:HD domain-containing protein [Treponema sp.]
MTRNIDPVLKEIASIFNKNKKEIYLVGGAVRDTLMGKKIHDWDLTTDAPPDVVTAIVKNAGGKVVPTGIKHGTVTIFYKKHSAEITTFRTESGYSDGRRPDQVNYASDINEDLSRRDFTMNAIALRLPSGEIVDPFNGAKDIKAKIIRCVGNAGERFNEDGLRPLRAVRFASALGFRIEENTKDAIKSALNVCEKVSKERVRDEIEKILGSPVPSAGFRLMEETGLLKLCLKELDDCRGIEQKGFHKFDVLDHLLLACDYAALKNYSLEVRLASLFHDIGKPAARDKDELGVFTFYRHEEISERMCRKILNRLRYSNEVIHKTCLLVKEHMFNYQETWTDSAVRRFIARIGEENLRSVFDLRSCDTYAFSGVENKYFSLSSFSDRIEELLAGDHAFSLKDLAVNGSDLMEIGVPAGKMLGVILKELLETVLDDPAQNTKEALLLIAKKIYSERISL